MFWLTSLPPTSPTHFCVICKFTDYHQYTQTRACFYHQQFTLVQKTSVNRHHLYLQESACVVAAFGGSRQIIVSHLKDLVYFVSSSVYKAVPIRLTRSMECCKKMQDLAASL